MLSLKNETDELRLLDAIRASFCFQDKSKMPNRLDLNKVYKSFAELRMKYPSWLQEMNFTYGPTGTVPISGALEDILSELGSDGISEVANPWYRFLRIPATRLKIFQKSITERRNAVEQAELRELANCFFELYGSFKKEK